MLDLYLIWDVCIYTTKTKNYWYNDYWYNTPPTPPPTPPPFSNFPTIHFCATPNFKSWIRPWWRHYDLKCFCISAAHRCFLWCQPEQAVEQTVRPPVIWGTMMLIRIIITIIKMIISQSSYRDSILMSSLSQYWSSRHASWWQWWWWWWWRRRWWSDAYN